MHILTLSCPDQPGIVSAVSTCLYKSGCNIEEAAQFHQPDDNHFFMRIIFSGALYAEDSFEQNFREVAKKFAMTYRIYGAHDPVKTVILVSQWDHCVSDLLYRATSGHLNIDIAAIISNHNTTQEMAARHHIPFHKLDVTPQTKAESEEHISELIKETEADLIVLARYMQILSSDFCSKYAPRTINIHHSFLPGFKGAKPYHQAYERGVKIIGASAHFATSDLDEGPIIAQDVQKIDHTYTPDKMLELGRDIERQTLAKAIKLYSEHRIFLHNRRTIIL